MFLVSSLYLEEFTSSENIAAYPQLDRENLPFLFNRRAKWVLNQRKA
jgi:hypothetical protein